MLLTNRRPSPYYSFAVPCAGVGKRLSINGLVKGIYGLGCVVISVASSVAVSNGYALVLFLGRLAAPMFTRVMHVGPSV